MSVNNEVKQINAEHALHDVIHIVCKYVKAKDLSNMAKVCKWWQEEALREQDKRYYNQQLRLPYKFDNLVSRLDVIPYASLLIYDSKLEQAVSLPAGNYTHSNGFEEELLEDFKVQLPNKTIVMRVDMRLSTDDVEFPGENAQRDVELSGNCELLGLLFPSMEGRVRVDVAWMDLKLDPDRCHHLKYRIEFFNQNPIVTRFAEELGLRGTDCSKSTILLLTSGGIENHTSVLRQLRRGTYQNCHKIVWASICGTKLAAANHSDNHGRSNLQSSVALRFSGPNVDSCSTFIYIHASREEIERKLQDLKKEVKLKRYHVGLLYSINCVNPGCAHLHHPCYNSREMMDNLKIIFPDIRFRGFYKNLKCEDNKAWFKNPDQSNNDRAFDENLLKNLEYYTSIIIISYD